MIRRAGAGAARGAIFLIQLYRHAISVPAAVVPVHSDLQSVRGRRPHRVRRVPRWVAGIDPAPQMRAMASGRMGSDPGTVPPRSRVRRV